MIALALTLALAVAPPTTGAGGATVHPFHITMAEAEFNPETNRLEVALRVYHPTDLEAALSRRAGAKVDLEKTGKVDDLILAYLREAFVATPEGAKEPARIEWVGKEVSLKTAWLYFEVDLPAGIDGTTFKNRLLFEVERDQANTIVFRDATRRASLRLTPSRDARVFTWQTADPEPPPVPAPG
jgi:hypothetical protein